MVSNPSPFANPPNEASQESVCESTEGDSVRDRIIIYFPSEVTELNHDFRGHFVCCLPNRHRLIQARFDDSFGGHLGVEKILNRIFARFLWSNLTYLLKAPLFSLPSLTAFDLRCTYVTENAQGPQNSQTVTINFRDHFAEGTETSPVTTIKVVPNQILGCVWCPFVPTLMPITDSFSFKALVDDLVTTRQVTEPIVNSVFVRSRLLPNLNLGGEEMGVGGSVQNDFFIDGRRRHLFQWTMDGSTMIDLGWTMDSGGTG